jgi:hypothetical protein
MRPAARAPLVIGWGVVFLALAVLSLIFDFPLAVGIAATVLIAMLTLFGLEGRGLRGLLWAPVVIGLAIVSFFEFATPLRVGAIVLLAALLVPYGRGHPRSGR